MFSSLRRRILVVIAIAVVGTAGVIFALWQWASTTTEQRRARAHETVGLEIDRLSQIFESAPSPETRRRGRRDFGPLKSGFLRDDLTDETGAPPFGSVPVEARAEAARQSKAGGGTVVIREAFNPAGQPLVVAAKALPQGGYIWAVMIVAARAESQQLRGIILFLAAASLLLVVASVQTLVLFQRDARSLRESLRALAADLGARVPRPRLAELGEIGDGVAQLAVDLDVAQRDKERLTSELAKKERLAALGRVAAGVAHEVRNPLASIKLKADLAAENPSVDPVLRRDLGDISREVARLDRFVKDLLVVAGRRDATRTDTDLGALARDRVALLAQWAKEREVEIEVRGDARAPVEVDAIARALDNLLRNAVEASPHGATVDVEIDTEGATTRLSVRDRGPGVDDAKRNQLFEPFFTTKPDGTGLGLALSLAVAAAHGGTVVYAREDARSCFTLSLPSTHA
jgi:signal transduction histidine kinase